MGRLFTSKYSDRPEDDWPSEGESTDNITESTTESLADDRDESARYGGTDVDERKS